MERPTNLGLGPLQHLLSQLNGTEPSYPRQQAPRQASHEASIMIEDESESEEEDFVPPTRKKRRVQRQVVDPDTESESEHERRTIFNSTPSPPSRPLSNAFLNLTKKELIVTLLYKPSTATGRKIVKLCHTPQTQLNQEHGPSSMSTKQNTAISKESSALLNNDLQTQLNREHDTPSMPTSIVISQADVIPNVVSYSTDLYGLLRDAIRKEEEQRIEEKYALKEAARFKQEWDTKMSSWTQGEFQTSRGNSHPEILRVAQEIIRRANNQNKLVRKVYVPDAQERLEFRSPTLAAEDRSMRMLEVFHELAKNNVLTYNQAVKVLQEVDLSTRREVYRLIVTHPFYKSCDERKKIEVKQELVEFFDRHFTSQLERMTGQKPLQEHQHKVLNLGADDVLCSANGFIVPSRGEKLLAKQNLKTWKQSRGLWYT